MWICDGCKMLVTLQVAEPQIDDDGICFICPVCHLRNELRALPRLDPDDPLDLEQIHRSPPLRPRLSKPPQE